MILKVSSRQLSAVCSSGAELLSKSPESSGKRVWFKRSH